MIKVFLVEDEIIMREGIKNNIDWEKEGFLFVGEASDGELAYPLIQQTDPDILITDIKMPFMNGLELSRLVKQEFPDIKIIILSGYDEFEYAQEGISIGITDYLVKPVSGAKLLETVKKVGKMVLDEQEQKKYRLTFEREQEENAQLARQKFFGRLVLNRMPVSAMLKEGRSVGLDLAANRYNIVLFQIFALEEGDGEYSERQNDAARAISQSLRETPEVLMIDLGMEGWAFILKENGETPLEEVQEQAARNIKKAMEPYADMEYFGGVGKPVERLSELKECYEEACRAFAYRYLGKRNQIVCSEQLQNTIQTAEMELGSLDAKKLDRRMIERFLKTGLKGEVEYFVDEYFMSLGEQNLRSLLFLQYVTMDLYFASLAMLEELGYDSGILVERCGDFQTMTGVFTAIETNKAYIKNVMETAIELREAVARRKYHSLLEDAKGYIEQNFQNEDISLNSVAASVNLSPNHFSTIFSQEMGKTFIEYLTSVRMEKARELLRTTSMKSTEIAYAVGYKDPHYFSYLFKKTQECTPREFRHQN